MNRYAVQGGQFGLQFAKQPYTNIFRGRILEQENVVAVSDVVETIVVEVINVGLHSRFNVSKIHQNAEFGLDFAFDFDFYAKTMAVHTSAFVAFFKSRNKVRGLKGEFLGDDKWHTGAKLNN